MKSPEAYNRINKEASARYEKALEEEMNELLKKLDLPASQEERKKWLRKFLEGHLTKLYRNMVGV